MLPHFFHPKNQGFYNKIYNRIVKNLPQKPNLLYLPPRRASQMFVRQGVDCIFIASKKRYSDMQRFKDMPPIIYSDTINKSAKRVYSLKGSTLFSDTESLMNKKLLADVGAGSIDMLYEAVPLNAKIMHSESIKSSIEMLRAGRVDAVIAYELDMEAYLQANDDGNDLQSDPNFVLQTGESVIACWDKSKTKRFLKRINVEISTLHAQ